MRGKVEGRFVDDNGKCLLTRPRRETPEEGAVDQLSPHQ